MSGESQEMSFWDHLDVLRKSLIRSAIFVGLTSVILFFFKDFLFDTIIFAPTKGNFWLYQVLHVDFNLQLINIDVAAQFTTHIRITFIAALIVSVPYLIYEIWKFVSPALFQHEKTAIRGGFMFAAVLFYVGAAVGYFIVLPLMLNFFADYQVSELVSNTFSLKSYIGLFASSVLLFGLVFEFPTIIKVMSAMGLVTRGTLKQYRKHAICGVVILAAVITPSGDPFSLLVVSIPLYFLYEFSILICRKGQEEPEEEKEI